jgi:predicted nucleotidyltransferase
MDIKNLIQNLKSHNLPKSDYAVFGSAVMAVRGMREAPNIDVIVTNKLWSELLEKNRPDEEGFIRLTGQIKISNWWFAPTRKTISQLITEAEEIDGLPFVQLDEVLDYKQGLNRPKDIEDVRLIKEYMAGPSNLGIDTYRKFIDLYVREINRLLGDKIFGLIIFGSVARGKAKGDSDIDMFTFYDGDRDEVNDTLIGIITSLRKNQQYKRLSCKGIHPEVYPFLISRKKAMEPLAVFLDATDHGIILKDDGTIQKLIGEIKESKAQRNVLPNGKWVWTNLI